MTLQEIRQATAVLDAAGLIGVLNDANLEENLRNLGLSWLRYEDVLPRKEFFDLALAQLQSGSIQVDGNALVELINQFSPNPKPVDGPDGLPPLESFGDGGGVNEDQDLSALLEEPVFEPAPTPARASAATPGTEPPVVDPFSDGGSVPLWFDDVQPEPTPAPTTPTTPNREQRIRGSLVRAAVVLLVSLVIVLGIFWAWEILSPKGKLAEESENPISSATSAPAPATGGSAIATTQADTVVPVVVNGTPKGQPAIGIPKDISWDRMAIHAIQAGPDSPLYQAIKKSLENSAADMGVAGIDPTLVKGLINKPAPAPAPAPKPPVAPPATSAPAAP
ncbi:MAG: hypothetical protein WC768_00085 [Patescibacteria group bacterium]|jgi:hypothetical protein